MKEGKAIRNVSVAVSGMFDVVHWLLSPCLQSLTVSLILGLFSTRGKQHKIFELDDLRLHFVANKEKRPQTNNQRRGTVLLFLFTTGLIEISEASH